MIALRPLFAAEPDTAAGGGGGDAHGTVHVGDQHFEYKVGSRRLLLTIRQVGNAYHASLTNHEMFHIRFTIAHNQASMQHTLGCKAGLTTQLIRPRFY